jgi:hypothetical protein
VPALLSGIAGYHRRLTWRAPVRGRLPVCSGDALAGVDLPLSTVDVAEKRERLRSAGFEAWEAGNETAG